MKFITATILMLLMLTQSFSKWMLVLEYELNKKFIAEKLCVNKSKPTMHSNGKCYLAKKIMTDEDPSQSGSHKMPALKFVEVSFTEPATVYSNSIPSIALTAPDGFYVTSEYDSPVHSIFHPPLFLLLHA